ncbi:MAG: hypothetical protein AB7O66_07175 [Limisphaerales bacterium]
MKTHPPAFARKSGKFFVVSLLVLVGFVPGPGARSETAAEPKPATRPHGPPSDPAWFPIGVWLQDPRNAVRYRDAGINVYVGLWKGPTAAQLEMLGKAGMRVICSQNAVGLSQRDNPMILGWMHGDEPDNAQSLPGGKGYGPPILPEVVRQDYERMRQADPSRPVLLNLGQGVAWDDYIGRGVRRNHPEDYPRYVEGADIVSFDIYPAVHDHPAVAGKLEFVARGVQRLVAWAGPTRTVWNCIECTRISNPATKPTPAQVRSEVWMSLIHGSRGLIYFVHQFRPVFREAALLDDPEMLAAVTSINRRIRELAPVLNSPSIPDRVTVTASVPEAPIAWMHKRHRDADYVFAVNLRNEEVKATLGSSDWKESKTHVEALDETRSLGSAENGHFEDAFGPYAVHLYRLARVP